MVGLDAKLRYPAHLLLQIPTWISHSGGVYVGFKHGPGEEELTVFISPWRNSLPGKQGRLVLGSGGTGTTSSAWSPDAHPAPPPPHLPHDDADAAAALEKEDVAGEERDELRAWSDKATVDEAEERALIKVVTSEVIARVACRGCPIGTIKVALASARGSVALDSLLPFLLAAMAPEVDDGEVSPRGDAKTGAGTKQDGTHASEQEQEAARAIEAVKGIVLTWLTHDTNSFALHLQHLHLEGVRQGGRSRLSLRGGGEREAEADVLKISLKMDLRSMLDGIASLL